MINNVTWLVASFVFLLFPEQDKANENRDDLI
jgi:hypothetical protein